MIREVIKEFRTKCNCATNGVQDLGQGKIEGQTEGRGRSQGGNEDGRSGITWIGGRESLEIKAWAWKKKEGNSGRKKRVQQKQQENI